MNDNCFSMGWIFCSVCCFALPKSGPEDLKLETALRRPIGIAVTSGGETLVVANSATGSVSVIDISGNEKPRVVSELKVVAQTGGLAANSDGSQFVITDFKAHRLVAIRLNQNVPRVQWEQGTIGYPSAVSFSPDDATIAVAGHWSRQLSLIPATDGGSVPDSQPQVFDLDFVPGYLCWLDDSRLLVADEYSNHLIVVDSTNRKITKQGAPSEHRFGGLAIMHDRKRVMIAGQVLNALARSTRNDIHWGLMISNRLSWIDVDTLIDHPAGDRSAIGFADYFPIGEPANAKGDPGRMWIAENGSVAVTLGGVQQLGISVPGEFEFAYVNVGRRPIAITGKGNRAFVANQLDDTISIVDVATFENVGTVSLGPKPTLSLENRGQQLFFDATLSHDGWLSCHSCHPSGHTSDHLNDNLSDQTFGTPKRIISLLKPSNSQPFAWDGSRASLSEQIRKSLVETMRSDVSPADNDVAAITAFLETLQSPPSVDAARGRSDDVSIAGGSQLFDTLGCAKCHTPPIYTTDKMFDVGMPDERGMKKINPPSLLGIGQRNVFFHDARAKSLHQVFNRFKHQLPRELQPAELSQLESFLHSL